VRGIFIYRGQSPKFRSMRFIVSEVLAIAKHQYGTHCDEFSGPYDATRLLQRFMRTAHHEFAGGRVERFASVEERSTTRMKSRFSYNFSALAASGKPSANRSVPNRVSTGSGVATSAGIVVVILKFFRSSR
jgi:hypothetical protein